MRNEGQFEGVENEVNGIDSCVKESWDFNHFVSSVIDGGGLGSKTEFFERIGDI